jgi:hypothetical protein
MTIFDQITIQGEFELFIELWHLQPTWAFEGENATKVITERFQKL